MFIAKRIYNSLSHRYWHFVQYHFPFFWARRLYRTELGKSADFRNPRDLNEKIQWLEFFTDTTLWSLLADKYRVRDYVAKRVGSHILIPLLGHWDKAEDIDFDSLPDKFVIKPNNGSYDTVVVSDKSKADIEDIRKKMAVSLRNKFGFGNAEPHYLCIRPCIVAEQLLETEDSYGLVDYKIWCFNGNPYCIFACFNRDPHTHHADFMCYDLDWQRRPDFMSDDYKTNCDCPRPANLETMLDIAKRLSKGLPQCRVDLYNLQGKIYFGELTLTSNYGMMPYFTQTTLDTMGDLCELPTPTFRESFSCFLKRYLPRL